MTAVKATAPIRGLREAMFYDRLPDGRVHCRLCPHDCRIADGVLGACGVRVNHRGTLYTLVYDRIAANHVDPIEKKPLFHFYPGSTAYSIATVGCCLRCTFCQNWEMSQWPKTHLARKTEWEDEAGPHDVCPALAGLAAEIPGRAATPQQIVDAATRSGARSIAYTYTEPTIFFELAYDAAVRARSAGLKNVFVSSGFTSAAPLRHIAPVLDAVNVDLKFFREESYTHISRARLAPVLDAIRLYHDLGVWLEVTTLVIPGINDSDEELSDIARFVRSVGAEVPWHVTQFYPTYEMLDRPPTPIATLRRARALGLDAGLRYVYEGNVPGEGGENTRCYACGTLLIERHGHSVIGNYLRAGRCPECSATIDGVGLEESGASALRAPLSDEGGVRGHDQE
ncbi:MAG TPA: AmmeMemoRadiSam system radical SAM enzyme [Gemmatimonadales bacterium]|nr:AmmeMemoRadiSam system radical SAM enzyme [Gemmatimonadales bacterium]